MEPNLSKLSRLILFFGKGMEENEKRAAIATFIEDLKHFFEPKGFKYAKAYQAFHQRDQDLMLSFALNLFVHPDSFTIRPLAGVRHEVIEGLFHRISDDPETVQRDSGTVLWSWALEKTKPRPSSYVVDRSSRVAGGVEFTKRYFEKWIEPFFLQNSSLTGISNTFNEGRRALRSKNPYDWFRLLSRALIAAKLSKRDDYDALKAEYRRALEKHCNQRIISYNALIEILNKEM